MDRQTRVTDLVPRRLTSLAGFFVANLLVAAGLVFLYAKMPEWSAHTSDGRIEAFDLDSEGSLGVWFSSTWLSLSGIVALVVYSVRRYRSDDYSGRYRVWVWAAMCWFMMSLDETASLHEGFKEMMTVVTGRRLMGDGSIWWVMPYFFLLGAVGARLLVDVRECKPSAVALFSVAGCYAVAVAAQLGWIAPDAGARAVMIEEGAELIGDLMLLMAMLLMARHVVLDAEGKLARPKVVAAPARGPRDAAAAAEADDAPDFKELRPDPPHPLAQPAIKRPAVAAVGSPAAATESEGDLASRAADPLLSKAERKALRRKLEQLRERREQRLS